MGVNGFCDEKFEPVLADFSLLVKKPDGGGAALCIQIGGQTVVDIWGGTLDKIGKKAWEENTIVNIFSCTKIFTAVAVLQLVEEGKLELDAAVAEYWPEFAVAGKESITVRHVLCHQAGMPALRDLLSPEALYDWPLIVNALAAQAPWWSIGEGHGYEAVTYGWLLGELLRRIDRCEPGEAIIKRVCRPLGLDLHIGMSDSEFYRVADVSRVKDNFGDEASRRLLGVIMSEPQSMTTLAFANPSSIMTDTNTAQWRRMQHPAINGHGTARSLAGFYSGLLDGRLLSPESLIQLIRAHSEGADKTLLTSTRFGLGCMLDQPEISNATYGASPRAFGHPGAGGSVGFADPEHDLAFGFVTNSLGPYVLMDPRAQRLTRTALTCL